MIKLSEEELEEYKKLYHFLVDEEFFICNDDTIGFTSGAISINNPDVEVLRLIVARDGKMSKIMQQFPLLTRKIEILNTLMI